MFEITSYKPIVEFLGDMETAAILYGIHLIALKKNNDWVFLTYKDMNTFSPSLSKEQIGRRIRQLESYNWFNSGKACKLVSGASALNQIKGYKIQYKKIFQDTGFNFPLDTSNESACPMETPIKTYHHVVGEPGCICSQCYTNIYRYSASAWGLKKKNDFYLE